MNNEELISQVTEEIFSATMELQTKSPALYLLLNETPLVRHPITGEIVLSDYLQYLDTLKKQLKIEYRR